MSEEKQIALVPHADFTIKDIEIIEKFKENGMLGLHTLGETDVERMMSLYMDGKTYRQISNITSIKKDVILFVAHKFSWWELRKDYLDELNAVMKDKITQAKIQTQGFLFDLLVAYRKKMGRNINLYLKTDNEEWMDKLDNKDLGVIFKCVELLDKLDADTYKAEKSDKSLVAFNGMGEGVTITKTGNNSVEITPKASGFSSKLKSFADLKREQERTAQAPKPVHDIVLEETLTEKEDEEENKNEENE